MNKNLIIDELYRSDKVKALIATLPEKYSSDLTQEVFMLLLIKPEVELIDLYKRGKLFAFFCSLIFNQLKWTNSSFHKLYNTFEKNERRAEPEEVAAFEDRLQDGQEVDLLPFVEMRLKELGAHKEALIRMYASTKSYREVAELSGISVGGSFNAIAAIRKEIISKLESK